MCRQQKLQAAKAVGGEPRTVDREKSASVRIDEDQPLLERDSSVRDQANSKVEPGQLPAQDEID
jgi:hypothetical protein